MGSLWVIFAYFLSLLSYIMASSPPLRKEGETLLQMKLMYRNEPTISSLTSSILCLALLSLYPSPLRALFLSLSLWLTYSLAWSFTHMQNTNVSLFISSRYWSHYLHFFAQRVKDKRKKKHRKRKNIRE